MLFLPALAVVARAAPTEVVAGRVVTHAVPSLTSSLLHQVRAVPAFHAVPATHVFHGAPADNADVNRVVAGRVVDQAFPSLASLRSSPLLHPVRAVPAFHAVPATHVVHEAPADDTEAAEVVAARVVPQAFPPTLSLSPLNQVRAVPALTEVPAPNAVPSIRAIPTVDDSQIIIPNVAEGSFNIHPQYSFGYSISDSVTGDSKTRQESRDGDAVSGSYSVADPDGRIRTVTYTADALHGFQATVTYDGEEGPVAIPFNSPSTTVAVQAEHSNEETGNIVNNDSVITAARTVPTPELPNTVTAVKAVPAVQDIQTLHSLGNSLTAVRTVPSVLNLSAVPHQDQVSPITVVRTLPAVQLPHAVHNLTPRVTAVRTLQGVPADLSSVRTIQGVPQGLTAVRTVPALQTIGGSPIFLRNSNIGTHLDLSQFQFLNTGRVL